MREKTVEIMMGVAVALLVVIGIVSVFMSGIAYEKEQVGQLPACQYDIQIDTPNNVQPGYYIGHNPECILRMDNTTVRVDAGLLNSPV